MHKFFFFLGLFRATPAAYGGSQARGWISAVAGGLHYSHRNLGLSRIYDLHHSSGQCRILEARDQTHILLDTSRVHYC